MRKRLKTNSVPASRIMALKNRVAASYYGNNMLGCAKKAVLRMEPDLKRTVCKYCQAPLIPGETVRVRLKSKTVRLTCLTCMNVRKFPTKRGHKLWIDQPEAIVQILDYAQKSETESTSTSDWREEISNTSEELKKLELQLKVLKSEK
ncbi:ribonuclease P protein subunit p21 isoform X2 [Pseudomyrmex gracilis]|uniref:ribonuclease P protein subunit p21 isoform X2 n=1 Tax=Pseudomyrmex gracilis TaxID=219809 RepID=UPI000995C417|nr:ribonuclease P protein subunit p21 isoform X2 [Pseudomyrmex gracilis]